MIVDGGWKMKVTWIGNLGESRAAVEGEHWGRDWKGREVVKWAVPLLTGGGNGIVLFCCQSMGKEVITPARRSEAFKSDSMRGGRAPRT